MRYRDTRGDDTFLGTTANDIFVVRRGWDKVDGAGGSDRLIVDYAGRTSVSYAPDRITVTETGSIHGELFGDDTSGVTFENVERLSYVGSEARSLMWVLVAGPAPRNAITVDVRGGEDSLDLQFVGTAPESVEVLAGNIVSTRVGTFAGFERISLSFGDGADRATGGEGRDYLYGRGGGDVFSGQGGDDLFYGGPGADLLTGGAGADRFYYRVVSDTRADRPDQILDFSHADGDLIDLGRIDANPAFERNQAFAFIDQRAFTGPGGNGGEVRQQINADGTITVQGDRNSDGVADFAIIVHAASPLVAEDFYL